MDPLKSLEIKTRNIYPHIGMIRSSFNGLVLVQEHEYNLGQRSVFLQVRNLFTKCCLTLPKCPSHCSHQACGVALGFDPSTKEYKVVHIYDDGFGFEIFTLGCSDNSWRTIPGPFQESNERPYDLQTFRWRDPVSVNGRVMHCALGFDPSTNEYKVVHICGDGYSFEIFTLGCSDNAWRTVPGPFKEPNEQPFDVETFEWGDPASVNGRVMYWYVDTNEYFVSMNISDEKAYKTYLPKLDQEIEIGRFSFMEMGGNLSFWYQISSTQIDVWILKDLHGRNWLKIHSMMMESINYKYPNTKSCSTSNKFNPLPDFMKLIPVAAFEMVK
ncbi:hypothetical protein LWI28_025416 [Acer negundo]|uniref:F-box associated beta-propeller type 3 domain-containing protein n=1 Tax=Acer negundo TaxID=4023 RepID=A0AAD5I8D7_ACENE|nr:hypothetical protein LWI28_025416 [Acer negundo]